MGRAKIKDRIDGAPKTKFIFRLLFATYDKQVPCRTAKKTRGDDSRRCLSFIFFDHTEECSCQQRPRCGDVSGEGPRGRTQRLCLVGTFLIVGKGFLSYTKRACIEAPF